MIWILALCLSVLFFLVFVTALLMCSEFIPNSVFDVDRVLLHGIDDSDDILLKDKDKSNEE